MEVNWKDRNQKFLKGRINIGDHKTYCVFKKFNPLIVLEVMNNFFP